MKNLYQRFNEALAALKKASPKKFNTAFDECLTLPTIETKLNCVEAALTTVKESNGGQVETFRENRPPITKNNGAEHNGNAPVITESTCKNVTAGESRMYELMVESGQMTRAQRDLLEGKVTLVNREKYTQLSEGAKREWNFARLCGISEADAFKVVQLTGGYGNKGYSNRL
jgi:hypothetical protein